MILATKTVNYKKQMRYISKKYNNMSPIEKIINKD